MDSSERLPDLRANELISVHKITIKYANNADLPSSTPLSCMADSASDVYLIFPCSLPPSLFLRALENLPDGVVLELRPVQDPDHKRPDRPIPTDPAPSFPELPLRISNLYSPLISKEVVGC